MGSINFYDQEDFRGNEVKVTTDDDQFQVENVNEGDSSVASINVIEGAWLLYSKNNFLEMSIVLFPGLYKNPMIIKEGIQSPGEKWTGQIRSYRLITPASLMLFDNDYYRGERSVIRDTTPSIEDRETKSLIIESGIEPPAQPVRLDLAFVLDGSASIQSRNFEAVKGFAFDMVSDLRISPKATRIGMIQYSSSVVIEFQLAKYTEKDSVVKAIRSVRYQNGGSTKTGQALHDVRTKMDRDPHAKRVVIVVTDGHAQDDVEGPAKALKNADYIVYAVGVGNDISRDELETIAQDPSKVYLLKDYDELKTIVEDISQSVAKAKEWTLYELGQKKEWSEYAGFYNEEDIRRHLPSIGSAERLY